MTSVAHRLKQVIEDQGHTIYDIEKKLGLSKSRLHKILQEDRSISTELVIKIAEFLHLSQEDVAKLIFPSEISSTVIIRETPNEDPIQSMAGWMSRMEKELDILKRKIEYLEEKQSRTL